jgi:glycerol-3-phosphate dehydrogenase
MVIALIQSAKVAGAYVHNHHAVTQLLKDTEGHINGVEVIDKLKGSITRHSATVVVNATGPFADTIRRMDDPGCSPLIETSSGIHIVLPRRFLPSDMGVMIPKTSDGRLLFALPWQGHCLVGTTDNPAKLTAHPPVTEDEIDFLLSHLNHYFALKATREDILSTFSGLRPLITSGAHDSTATLVRESEYRESPSGLLSVAGGKWTSYRAMAQKTIDIVIASHPSIDSLRPCTTLDHKVVGSRDTRKSVLAHLQSHPQLAPLANHLYDHYGDQSPKILDHVEEEGDLHPLMSNPPITRAEIRYTLAQEHVRKPLDFLVRRSVLGLLDREKARALLPEVISIMTETLHWDSSTAKTMKSEAKERLATSI